MLNADVSPTIKKFESLEQGRVRNLNPLMHGGNKRSYISKVESKSCRFI